VVTHTTIAFISKFNMSCTYKFTYIGPYSSRALQQLQVGVEIFIKNFNDKIVQHSITYAPKSENPKTTSLYPYSLYPYSLSDAW